MKKDTYMGTMWGIISVLISVIFLKKIGCPFPSMFESCNDSLPYLDFSLAAIRALLLPAYLGKLLLRLYVIYHDYDLILLFIVSSIIGTVFGYIYGILRGGNIWNRYKGRILGILIGIRIPFDADHAGIFVVPTFALFFIGYFLIDNTQKKFNGWQNGAVLGIIISSIPFLYIFYDSLGGSGSFEHGMGIMALWILSLMATPVLIMGGALIGRKWG